MDPRGFPTSLPEFSACFPMKRRARRSCSASGGPYGFVCPKCSSQGARYRRAAPRFRRLAINRIGIEDATHDGHEDRGAANAAKHGRGPDKRRDKEQDSRPTPPGEGGSPHFRDRRRRGCREREGDQGEEDRDGENDAMAHDYLGREHTPMRPW